MKQLIVPNKNDVKQHKWPMLGQKTFYHLSFVLYDVIFIRRYKLLYTEIL